VVEDVEVEEVLVDVLEVELDVDVDEVVEMLRRDKERSEKYQQGE
jgi:hypothetical protein